MEFELSPSVAYGIKAAAALVAIITAYTARGDALRSFLSRFVPKKAQSRTPETSLDAALRVLLDDAIDRQCSKSVNLINALFAVRTTSQIKTSEPDPLPETQRTSDK